MLLWPIENKLEGGATGFCPNIASGLESAGLLNEVALEKLNPDPAAAGACCWISLFVDERLNPDGFTSKDGTLPPEDEPKLNEAVG